MLVASLLMVCVVTPNLSANQSLQPVHFQTIKVDGFWQAQFKRLTEKWIPHCIKQMEEAGQGQELLNLINTTKALRGDDHAKFTGLPWSDAYVYNTVESICLALEIDPAGDKELAEAANPTARQAKQVDSHHFVGPMRRRIYPLVSHLERPSPLQQHRLARVLRTRLLQSKWGSLITG